MSIEYDGVKDQANLDKHGLSLSCAREIDLRFILQDDRKDYGEIRYRGFGLLDGNHVCLVFTIRGDNIRAISLRRANRQEIKRYEQANR